MLLIPTPRRQSQADLTDFKASLLFILSSRPAKVKF